MSKQEVILCESLEVSLGRAIEKCPHDRLFILTDEQTPSPVYASDEGSFFSERRHRNNHRGRRCTQNIGNTGFRMADFK